MSLKLRELNSKPNRFLNKNNQYLIEFKLSKNIKHYTRSINNKDYKELE